MEQIIFLLSKYKYLLLYPLAIVEGPIIAVIAGFLCIRNFLNPLIVYPIIVAGDMTGDSLVYMLGRFKIPKLIKKIAKRLSLNSKKIQKVRSYFDANPIRVVALSKITLGVGFAGIYLAGNAKIPYGKFIVVCFLTSASQYIFYLGLGLLCGSAYKQINQYLDFITALVIVIVIGFFIIFYIKSLFKKL